LTINQSTSRLPVMKALGMFEAKTRLSEVCETVARAGKAYVVTRRGTALVRIEPIREEAPGMTARRAAYRARYGNEEPDDTVDFEVPERSRETRHLNGLPGD